MGMSDQISVPVCRGCGTPLSGINVGVADMCPCNNPRGINHGIVPHDVCTCPVCDPGESGSSRISIGEMTVHKRESR